MIIHVLGLGPTIEDYLTAKPTGTTIGVNDAVKYNPDYLVIVDLPNKFSADRKEAIHSYNGNLISQRTEWRPDILIRLQPYKEGWQKQPGKIFSAFTSAFVATDYAFDRLGANTVVLWGVDIKGHPVLDKYFDIINSRFAYYGRDKQLYKGSDNCPLNLPLWKQNT